MITLGRDASEERTARSVVRVAVSARRTIASRRLSGWRSALRAWSSSASRDFSMDEAAPFAVGARSGDPESLGECQTAVTSKGGRKNVPCRSLFCILDALGPCEAPPLRERTGTWFRTCKSPSLPSYGRVPFCRDPTSCCSHLDRYRSGWSSGRRWRPGKLARCCSQWYRRMCPCIGFGVAWQSTARRRDRLARSSLVDRTGWQIGKERVHQDTFQVEGIARGCW